jgi:3,4-dihydroxy 2-butanone 4-phosphate synthase / GTP cyclohydrolase II
VRLLTNNPEKVRQLEEHGIDVAERVPLVVGVGAFNEGYLETKRDRMGHAIGSIDQTPMDDTAAIAAERTTR